MPLDAQLRPPLVEMGPGTSVLTGTKLPLGRAIDVQYSMQSDELNEMMCRTGKGGVVVAMLMMHLLPLRRFSEISRCFPLNWQGRVGSCIWTAIP